MALLNLEGYWQNILATFVENGNINIRDELGSKAKFLKTCISFWGD